MKKQPIVYYASDLYILNSETITNIFSDRITQTDLISCITLITNNFNIIYNSMNECYVSNYFYYKPIR